MQNAIKHMVEQDRKNSPSKDVSGLCLPVLSASAVCIGTNSLVFAHLSSSPAFQRPIKACFSGIVVISSLSGIDLGRKSSSVSGSITFAREIARDSSIVTSIIQTFVVGTW